MASLMRVAQELPVIDMNEALQHYERQLGFDIVMTMPRGDYAIVERDGVALHLYEEHASLHSPASIHIFASGLDDLMSELQRRGARFTRGIERHPWGNRDFRVVDPSGNDIKFTEPIAAEDETA